MNLSLSSRSSRRFLSSRRAFLAGACAVGATLLLAPQAARAQASAWVPVDYTINQTDTTNSGHLLWKNTSTGQYQIWKLDATGHKVTSLAFAPTDVPDPKNSAYNVKQTVVGSTGYTITFWDAPTLHRAALWGVMPDGNSFVSPTYNAPYVTNTDTPIAFGNQSNGNHMLWSKANGQFFFQTITGSTLTSTSGLYGPFTDVKPIFVTISNDQRISVALTNPSTNQAKIMVLPETYGAISKTYTFGPYTGATLKKIESGSDNDLRLLWTYSSGKAAIWTVGIADGAIKKSAAYAPAGVTPITIGVDSGKNVWVLWKYPTNKVALWKLSPDLSTILAGYTYGPL